MVGGLCVPGTRKVIMAVALIGKNDFDTSDKKLDSNLLSHIMRSPKGDSPHAIKGLVSVHLSVLSCLAYELLSPWLQDGCSHSRHRIHHTKMYPEMDEKKWFFLTLLFRD